MLNMRIADFTRFAILVATIIFLSSCASKRLPLCAANIPPSGDRSHLLDCTNPGERLVPKPDNCQFDWQHKGPLDFLAFLETSDPGGTDGACFITCKHVGWIKRADVPQLIALLDCQTSCREVLQSSMLKDNFNSAPRVDYQALVMLESYQNGYYPYLDSAEKPFPQRREAFLEWWAQQK